MSSPTEDFFADVDRRGYVPELANDTGRVRFEVVDGYCTEHWMISIDAGRVAVSREDGADVDGVVHVGRPLFDRAVRGEANLMAGLLRGEMSVDGSLDLILMIMQLLPGPAVSRPPEAAAVAAEGSAS